MRVAKSALMQSRDVVGINVEEWIIMHINEHEEKSLESI